MDPYGCISIGNENEENMDPGARGMESTIISSHLTLRLVKTGNAGLGAIRSFE